MADVYLQRRGEGQREANDAALTTCVHIDEGEMLTKQCLLPASIIHMGDAIMGQGLLPFKFLGHGLGAVVVGLWS